MKKFILIIAFLMAGKAAFSQKDYIIMKINPDTVFCKINEVKLSKIYFEMQKGEVYYKNINDVGSYCYNGIVYIVSDSNTNSSTGVLPVKQNIISPNNFIRQAGNQLKISSNHYYIGISCSIAGSLISYIGLQMDRKRVNGVYEDNKLQMPFIMVGAAASVIGFIYTVECFSHIGKAGKILMGNSVSQAKISLNSGVDGIGFACKF